MKRKPLKFRTYQLVSRAVEEGIAHSIRRAYKHTDQPSHDLFAEHILREVMNALDEIVDFDMEDSK